MDYLLVKPTASFLRGDGTAHYGDAIDFGVFIPMLRTPCVGEYVVFKSEGRESAMEVTDVEYVFDLDRELEYLAVHIRVADGNVPFAEDESFLRSCLSKLAVPV